MKVEIKGQIHEFQTYKEMIDWMDKHNVGLAIHIGENSPVDSPAAEGIGKDTLSRLESLYGHPRGLTDDSRGGPERVKATRKVKRASR
jgi:hypothetical protein